MTMDKFGVESVKETQTDALAAAKAKLREIRAPHEKTAAEASQETQLRFEIAELEKAIGAQ